MGINQDLRSGQDITVRVRGEDGVETSFLTTLRIDTPVEVEYYKQGGVLQTVLERILTTSKN